MARSYHQSPIMIASDSLSATSLPSSSTAAGVPSSPMSLLSPVTREFHPSAGTEPVLAAKNLPVQAQSDGVPLAAASMPFNAPPNELPESRDGVSVPPMPLPKGPLPMPTPGAELRACVGCVWAAALAECV